jgi:adenine-specific DNA-methyltransferase
MPFEPNKQKTAILMQKVFETIKQLAADFKAQEAAYLSPSYQESQVRQDFIDKFFTALGWDVTHERQKNPYEQEVHIENKVSMAGSQRRADYAFFLAPNFRNPKFFVEAKKPQKNLANAGDYHQTLRYGWNAGTPLAILTDFEEFHILDCRYKPNIDEALDHKIEYFHYSDYANEEKFAQLYWLFSQEAVAGGSIEKRAAELPKPRGGGPRGKALQRGLLPARRGFGGKGGYQPVDEAFLEELDGYREQLAKAFKKANEELEGEELTEAIQRTLDRLVFIRFLEDKQIEEPEIINLRSRESAWKGFLVLCKRMEPKYNGLVFKPHRVIDSKEFEPPDDTVFADICDELADPASPYNFDQIPISILGSIYERFLGKVVHATDKRVKVEEKPEVRKAGGVYYTPEYIVRYIVNETIGKLLYGETVAATGGRGMQEAEVVDLGYKDHVSKNPTSSATKTADRTTSATKTPEQVAKMAFADIACGSGSFLIEVYNTLLEYHIRYYIEHPEKVKEGDVFERNDKLHLSLKKKKEILTNNIYGVDIDFQATEVTQLSLYLKMLEEATITETHQFGMFKEALLPDLRNNIVNGNSLIGWDIMESSLFPNVDEEKLKPMNFEDAFPNVMKKGGFDAVVGNPPWGSLFFESEKKYLLSKYVNRQGEAESHLFFIEKAIHLLKKEGTLGYITPNTWLSVIRSKETRRFILSNTRISKIVELSKYIFDDAPDIVPILLFIENKNGNQEQARIRTSKLLKVNSFNFDEAFEDKLILQNLWASNKDCLINLKLTPKTGLITGKCLSNATSLKSICEVLYGIKTGDNSKFLSNKKTKVHKYKALKTGELTRYGLKWKSFYIWWTPELAGYRKSTLEKEKIVIQYIRKLSLKRRIIAAMDVNGVYYPLNNYSYILHCYNKYSLMYVLAIINSSLINFYFSNTFIDYNIKPTYLEQLPIRTINFDDPADKTRHDHIVKLVEQMLEAKEKLSKAKTEAEVNRLEMLCQSLDHQIDEAVYELYGLTREEIAIVEGKA